MCLFIKRFENENCSMHIPIIPKGEINTVDTREELKGPGFKVSSERLSPQIDILIQSQG